MPVVYEQLRSLAAGYLRRDQRDQMLEPAVLVNETYLRLAADPPGSWKSVDQFLSVAAGAMRRVLIDHARRRRALKRGFGSATVSFELATAAGPVDVDVRALDDALKTLASIDEQASRIVELRFFGGLSHEQTARVLGVSRKTVVKHWLRARDWLAEELSDGPRDEKATRTVKRAARRTAGGPAKGATNGRSKRASG
jgi:RNA polymerase sigma factor (TIGR02999 family)